MITNLEQEVSHTTHTSFIVFISQWRHLNIKILQWSLITIKKYIYIKMYFFGFYGT